MGKVLRIIAIVLVGGLLLVGIIVSSSTKAPTDPIWDTATIMGNPEAKNHYITYTDVTCPYCLAFEYALIQNEEEFKKDYIEKKNIVYEVRVSDFLYQYGEHPTDASREGAEAIFCAKNEGKFWDYYNHVVVKLWETYFKNGIQIGAMAKLDKSYWKKLGEEVGLGETFNNCVENDETLDAVIESTEKTLTTFHKEGAGGMPYFKFNSTTKNGFSLDWGWDYVKYFLDSGIKK